MGETDRSCGRNIIIKPIVYGNKATHFGKKRESDGHTHEWTIYLRPFNNEDISKWIRKVQFKLHDSYVNSTRVLDKPPFEVTESGWGEFEITIRIFFVDSNEKPVSAFHYLRLFQPQIPTTESGYSKVVSEYYDEIVFQDPSPYMIKLLKAAEQGGVKKLEKRFYTDFTHKRKRTHDMILSAHREILAEINDLRESLKEAQKLILHYREEVRKTEQLEQSSTSIPVS